jgi:hypothetical protein
MKYLLAVGFYCDVYRQEPRARIFIDDKLIDEFSIKHQKKTNEFLKNFHLLKPNKDTINNLPTLQLYEIDINNKEQLTISIQIENVDNNYNNGFMTRNTLLQLNVFSFFPLNKKLFTRLLKIYDKKIKENYAWTRRYKNNIYNIENHTVWNGKNNQIIKDYSYPSISDYTIGGSGYFSCDLIKKYNMFIPKISKPYKFNIKKHFYNYIFDKYEQYANQRNTD